MLFYIERKWLYPQSYPWSPNCLENFSVSMQLMEVLKWNKINKIINKMKKFKRFCEAQTASRLKEIIQPSTRQKLPRSLEKNFLTEIHSHIQKFLFKYLENAFLRRLGMFFCPTPTRNINPSNGTKIKAILCLLEIYNASLLPFFFIFSPPLFRNNGQCGAKKRAVLKNFGILTGKRLCSTSLKRDSSTGVSCCEIFEKYLLWRTSAYGYFWTEFTRWLSGESPLKPSWLSKIMKIPVAFKPEF